jgi:heterodisulfide reductase subunit A
MLFSNDELKTNPMIASVKDDICIGCGICEDICPYKAIDLHETPGYYQGKRVNKRVARVNSGLCQGCGACTPVCRNGAIDLLGFTNNQILEEIDALCLP